MPDAAKNIGNPLKLFAVLSATGKNFSVKFNFLRVYMIILSTLA